MAPRPSVSAEPASALAEARRLCDEGMLDDAIALAWSAADDGHTDGARRLIDACAERKAEADRALHVVLVGDSLALPRPARSATYEPPRRPELSTARGATVAFLLERHLRARSRRPATVTLRSQASHGIRDVVRDLPLTLGYLDPDALVVFVGWVDVWLEDGERPRLGPRAFEAEVDALMTYHRALGPGRKLVVVGMPRPGEAVLRHRPSAGEWVAVYNEILRGAVSEPAEFVDFDELGDGAELVHGDGVHLSAAGHERLANALALTLSDERLRAASVARPGLPGSRRSYLAGCRHPAVGVELGGDADGGLVAGLHEGDGSIRVSAEHLSVATVSLGAQSSLITWTPPDVAGWLVGQLQVEIEALILGAAPEEGVVRLGDGQTVAELRLGAASSALAGEPDAVAHAAGDPLRLTLTLRGSEVIVRGPGMSRRTGAGVPGSLVGVQFGVDRPSGADTEIVWRRVRVRAGGTERDGE